MGTLLWFDVCWRYGVVRLGWCGIVMQAEALVPQCHTVTPTHIEPEQCTRTQSQAPEDECTSIRNMLSSKKLKQVTSVGLSLFNYQDYARSDKHKSHVVIGTNGHALRL